MNRCRVRARRTGGGLSGGIKKCKWNVLKHRYPGIKIIGVQPVESASMYESLRLGNIVTLDRVGTFADGVAVKRVGEETFRVAREVIDEIMLVSTDELCAAIKDIFEDVRVVVEPRAPRGRRPEALAERAASCGQKFIAGTAARHELRPKSLTERPRSGAREAYRVEIPEQHGL